MSDIIVKRSTPIKPEIEVRGVFRSRYLKTESEGAVKFRWHADAMHFLLSSKSEIAVFSGDFSHRTSVLSEVTGPDGKDRPHFGMLSELEYCRCD